MLMLRIMDNSPGWKQSPDHVTKPSTEEEMMGPYYPCGYDTIRQALRQEALMHNKRADVSR